MSALAVEADTGLVAKACRRMSGKRGPQGNAQKAIEKYPLNPPCLGCDGDEYQQIF